MPKQATRRSATGPPARARRLTAEARKRSILDAARRAFTENGDMTGTTIKTIAELGGISEGVIYRHFESKEQLFFEAVVDPLREAVDALVEAAEVVDADEPMTIERQVEGLNQLYGQLIATLTEVLPLLGLVLFGDPKMAQRFYRESFAVAMDRLADAWRRVAKRYGVDTAAPEISTRAVMGIALMLALENHHNSRFDRERAIALASEGTLQGFFPNVRVARKRR
jgi:AcrR family transcriptional regulator